MIALMRSKMRTVESTTVSARRSTRRERETVARATGSTSGRVTVASSSSRSRGRLVSESAGAMFHGSGTLWAVKPVDDSCLAIGSQPAGFVASVSVRGHTCAGVLHPGAVALDLLIGETEVAEAVLLFAVLAQLAEEAGGAALSGRGGVVQLVA